MAAEMNGLNGSTSAKTSNLEGFIATQIRQQEKKFQNDNLDKEKRDRFIARALAVSRKMNKEIEKSRDKSDQLYDELGQERMDVWRSEHAEEVLTAQQTELVTLSYPQIDK
ncbi:unnamed protein product [Lymnaea stagnalis]|uniref:Uncharacterized protein n=1 Tax=Lymnaea stagnalis TaxID=6523 RepID=A0AAV2H5U0_LYMST